MAIQHLDAFTAKETGLMGTVIGVAGSARRNGNSATLMRAALKGAASAGEDTSEIYLNGLLFKGCQGCVKCSLKGRCILNDDLTSAMEELRAADGWVLAAPIYFDSVSGQMKTFFDRCHTFIMDPEEQVVKPQLNGKRRGMVIITYEDEPRDDYHHEAQKLANYLRWMGDFGEIAIIAEGQLGPSEAARGELHLLERVERQGRAVFG